MSQHRFLQLIFVMSGLGGTWATAMFATTGDDWAAKGLFWVVATILCMIPAAGIAVVANLAAVLVQALRGKDIPAN